MSDATFSFHNVGDWVKKHPYATGIGIFAVGAVIIYESMSGSTAASVPSAAQGTGGTGGTGGALYAQELSAEMQAAAQQNAQNASLTALQDQLSAANNSINGAVSVAALNDQSNLGIASLDAGVSNASIAAQQTVDLAGITSNTKINLASVGASEFQTAANASVQGMQIYENAVQNVTANNNMFNYLTANLRTNAAIQASNNQTIDYAIYQQGVPKP